MRQKVGKIKQCVKEINGPEKKLGIGKTSGDVSAETQMFA